MSDSKDQDGSPSLVLRRSRQLSPRWAVILGVGLWLAVDVFALFDHVVWRAGARAGWAFLGAALLMAPTLLSHLEVRSWLGRAGGSYGLVKVSEHRAATFMAGWLYLIGGASAAALVALTFGRYASAALSHYAAVSVGPTVLAVAVIACCSAVLVTPYRPRWRSTVLLLSTGGVYLLFVTAQLAKWRFSGGGVSPGLLIPTGRDLYQAMLLLQAGGWSLELASRRSRRSDARSVAVTAAAGPIVAALLAILVVGSEIPLPTLQAVAESLPGGAPLYWLVGASACAAALHLMSLLMLRELHEIGQDGLLPERLLEHGPRLGTPTALIGLQAVTTVAFLAAAILLPRTDARLALAFWAAASFVTVQLLVNVVAVQLQHHPRAEARRIRLPLSPLIPSAGAALCFFLLLALPLTQWLLLLAALAVGVVWFGRYGRERQWVTEIGHTVFRSRARSLELKSDYPVVVTVANPDTAGDLTALAGRIAKAQDGHVVLVHVTAVSDHLPLAAGRGPAEDALSLLAPLVRALDADGIPVDAVSRLARTPEQGVLDSVEDAEARLLLLGWSVRERPDGHWQLGSILEDALGRAPCAVALVRGAWASEINDVLVPVGVGPNAVLAAEIGRACAVGAAGRVALLHVADPGEPASEERGAALLDGILRSLGADTRVTTQLTVDGNLARAIRRAVDEHEAVVMGAPEPRFLDPQEIGRLPLRIADETDVPLALVRRPISTSTLASRRMWRSVTEVLPTLTSAESVDLSRRLIAAARGSTNYYVLILLSAVIATLGLLLNSAAVIIGAMLIAPLMGPIVATAGGIATGNTRMLREGARSVVQGALLGMFVAVVVAAVTPITRPTSEVLSRTHPNLLDLMVGVAAGAAGAYVIARRELGEALPGVAIAAALMPPLTVAGIGLAMGRFDIAVGALLLFVANLIAIVFASAVIFLLLGTRPPRFATRERQLRHGLIVALVSLVAISVPLAFTLGESVLRNRTEDAVRGVVDEHVALWNATGSGSRRAPVVLESLDVDVGWRQVTVRGTIYAARPIRGPELADLEDDVNESVPQAVDVGLFAVSGQWLEAGDAPPTEVATATPTATPTRATARTRAAPLAPLTPSTTATPSPIGTPALPIATARPGPR